MHTDTYNSYFWCRTLIIHAGIPKWDKFVHAYLDSWTKKVINWVINNTQHPLHVVRYEDLQQNTTGEVKRILDFLKVSYEDQELERCLNVDFDTFHRKHVSDSDFEPYTPKQKDDLKAILRTTITAAEAMGKSDVLRLHEYLQLL